MSSMPPKKRKRGPEPDRLKIEGDPGDALDRLLKAPPEKKPAAPRPAPPKGRPTR